MVDVSLITIALVFMLSRGIRTNYRVGVKALGRCNQKDICYLQACYLEESNAAD